MREMSGEVGKKTPKIEMEKPSFVRVTVIKSGAKVVLIGLSQKYLF